MQKDIGSRSFTRSIETREKRSPLLTVGAALATTLVTLGVGVYCKFSIDQLGDYLDEIYEKMSAEEAFSTTIAANTRVLSENGKTLALKTNLLASTMKLFDHWNSCSGFRLAVRFQKERLFHSLNSLYGDLISGKITPVSFPVQLVNDMFLAAPDLISDTLYMDDILLVYKEASLFVVSVDVDHHMVELILILPRISRHPSFLKVNFLSPSSPIVRGTTVVSRSLQNMNSIFIPTSMVDQDGEFPIKTSEDIEALRRLSGCRPSGDRVICDSSSPLEPSVKTCISSLLFETNVTGSCEFEETKLYQIPVVSAVQGRSGVLLSTKSSNSIVAYRGDSRERIGSAHPLESDHMSCVWLPGLYDRVEVHEGDKIDIIHQKLRVSHQFSRTATEFGYYRMNSSHWNELNIEANLTLKEIQAMDRVKTKGHILGHHTANVALLFSTLLTVAFLLHTGIRCYCKRREAQLIGSQGREMVNRERPPPSAPLV